MATDHQVALSRSSHRLSHVSSPPTNHVSKQTRQVVPAFLQKLYEMVNDPKNGDLIRWSDTGDSFFVLDHERFAREVLGRWFKHQNFSSFVRQLNMYGFHKIPHLQQGVLRSETDTEFWNFAHANFHRGQPDLLCLIQRKKQSSQQQMQMQQQAEDAAVAAAAVAAAGLVTDGNGNSVVGVGSTGAGVHVPDSAGSTDAMLDGAGGGSSGLATLNNAQLLDIHSIVQGISAIKRHQAAISVELSELKRSNEILWQDALLAREKHQKQEDTINKIVKFLAGVFGKHATGGAAGLGNGGHHHGHRGDANGGNAGGVSVQRRNHGGNGRQDMHNEGNQDGMSVVRRRRARLMIEDGRRQTQTAPPPGGAKFGVNAVEVTEEGDDDAPMADDSNRGNNGSNSNNTGSGVGGRDRPPSPITTLSESSLPPRLDVPELGDNTLCFSALDLADRDGRGRRGSLDYPRIEMEAETPKSGTTPLPPGVASPGESVLSSPHQGQNVKKEATPIPHHMLVAMNADRPLARSPPVFHHQAQQPLHTPMHGYPGQPAGGTAGDAPFDPKSFMINLSPIQIQQLLTTLANHTISDPSSFLNNGSNNSSNNSNANHGMAVDGNYESGFNNRREDGSGNGHHQLLQQLQSHSAAAAAGAPQFDLSNFLVPSPQLSSMPLVNNGQGTVPPAAAAAVPTSQKKPTGPGSTSSFSTSSTTPSSSVAPPTAATTPQANDVPAPPSSFRTSNHTSTPSTSSVSSVSSGVPDGLIAFDGSGAVHLDPSSTTPGTSVAIGTTSPSARYGGDLSVGMRAPSPFTFPFSGYQGYGPYNGGPTASNTAAGGDANAGTNGGYGPSQQGYPDYGVAYNPASGGWSPTGSGTGGSGDFSGLFSPVLQGQRGGYVSPPSSSSGGQSQSLASTNANANNGDSVGQFNPHYNTLGSDSDTTMVASHPHLENLATNWRAAEDIDRDVNALNTTIHGLIQALGIDPSLMDGSGAHAEEGNDVSGEADGGVSNGVPGRGRGGGNAGIDFETLLSAWNNGNGSSESATTGSSSTPSTGEDADEGDDVHINSPPLPSAAIPYGSPTAGGVMTSPTLSRPSIAGSKSDAVGPGGPSPPRPINKKARTSLTASAPTSAGEPTKVEPAGPHGKKRRSAVIDSASFSGMVGLSSAGGDVAEGLDAMDGIGGTVEPAQLIGQDQHGPTGAGHGVQTRSAAKSKKRRG